MTTPLLRKPRWLLALFCGLLGSSLLAALVWLRRDVNQPIPGPAPLRPAPVVVVRPPDDSAGKAVWLAARVEGRIIPPASSAGPIAVEQFQGGQSNPTYRVIAGDRRYVLRRKPPGNLLPSAHAVDREYRVMAALAGTGVPVAKMIALCEDASVIGTAFYLMEYIDGRILWDPTLPGMTPAARAAHYDELNRVQAALHQVQVEDHFGTRLQFKGVFCLEQIVGGEMAGREINRRLA